MGLVIWYQLSFLPAESAPPLLRVSNDMLSGTYIVDAQVTTTARVGPSAASFEATLHDLPKAASALLVEQRRRGDLLVDVHLGYLDRPDRRRSVMRALVTEIGTVVRGGELLTILKGRELAGSRLLHTAFSYHRPGSSTLRAVLDELTATTEVNIIAGAEVLGAPLDLTDFTITGVSAMEVLARLAAWTGTTFAVRDGILHLGSAVTDGVATEVDTRTNLVRQSRRERADDDGATAATVYEFTVLGDPALALGGTVRTPAGPDVTITALRHRFLAGGFVTEVDAVAGPLTVAVRATGLEGFVDGLMTRVLTAVTGRTAVRVGDVDGYHPGGDGEHGGHRVTVNVGQDAPAPGAAPSVDAPVGTELALHAKPIVSPFAWDRCGLVVPAYDGMRAVLLHNGGEVNDAVAAGFVWSRHAGHTPPPNEPGDYWLSLPTEVIDGRPAGKGANDLTDASGHRVLQAAGLAVDVGPGTLPPIGVRPEELPADDVLVIRHSSGTTVTIDPGGGVTIATNGENVALDNGSAAITIEGGTITLAAEKVEVITHG
jgi:hypothetical protein